MSNRKERINKEMAAMYEQVSLLMKEFGNKKGLAAPNIDDLLSKLEAIIGHNLNILEELGEEKDDIIRRLHEKIIKKDQVGRFEQYSRELSKFMSRGFRVVIGPTKEEMVEQLYQIVGHAEGLWNDAVALFDAGSYATACFLSIVCIEECTKINFGWFQTLHAFENRLQPSTRPQGRNPLASHIRKHFLSACCGALVNSRMDKVLGIENVNSFISDCESGNLERLRQNCLYTDINLSEGIMLLPAKQISREQALFHICLAGEIFAEVGGMDPDTNSRLLSKVDEFEKKHMELED